ncbi:PREDICTED: uncharacterized protein LOC104809575 isoform X2 [Tarenaya hassleriana]|uniref:uncharacterized protein LOC104809575 isoform X1 n=1 Tax=Tarenaya hassleriana TaxID=28532 RepID=UPI00053C8718|nr:PREDICTED: uncharacterized protein LOC104809575 isoform X1 [Tarenaya hassleriana]XP_010533908.1 PREDICTED: uncharacterized protein LOC104809575 isoform X2 [Tarenaya hassleriana]
MGTPRPPSTDFYGIFGISRSACKAYKSIVMKFHHKSDHVSTAHRSPHDKKPPAEESDEDEDPMFRTGLRLQSMDDSNVFKRRESLFSRSSSRRSHTPQARPTYLSSSSSSRHGSTASFHRSISRRGDDGGEGGSSHGGGKMRGLKSRPFSENASPMASPFSSPKEKDHAFVSPIKGLSSPSSPLNNLSRSPSPINGVTSSSPMFSKNVSRREREGSVPLSKSTSMRKDASAGATMGRAVSRRSPTPIVFSHSVARRKPPPIERKLECTLEELCHGGVKNIKIARDVITDEGLIVQEEETLRINIKPGWKKGTKITFEGKGNEKPGYLPEDITFSIEEKRHPLFKRRGDDLEIAVEIPLLKALTGCTLSVPLLNGEKMALSIGEVIFHGFEKAIKGQGMPNAKEGGKRGDLRITFLVKFPEKLSEEQRFMVSDILKDCS